MGKMTLEPTAPEVIKKVPEYDPYKDPLHPAGNPCSICDSPFDDEEWGTIGWVGILPLSLCATCNAGIFDMVYTLTDEDTLKELLASKTEDAQVKQQLPE